MDYKQELIATSPNSNIWVSANAGAGKTHILTRRVLRMLAEGVNTESVLCLTYTNAAAVEMRERITNEVASWSIITAEACAKKLELITGKNPDDEMVAGAMSIFARLVDKEHSLKIETIHSFCQSLLRRFPIEAGIFPHFKLMGNSEKSVLTRTSMLKLLGTAQREEQLNEALSFIATKYSDGLIYELSDKIISEQAKWRSFFARAGDVGEYIKNIQKNLPATEFKYAENEIKCLNSAIAKMLNSKSASENRIAEKFAKWFQNFSDIEAYKNAWITKKGEVRSKIFTKDSKLNTDEESALLKEKLRIEKYLNETQQLNAAQENASLIRFAEALLAIYEHEKLARGWMDFDDMIINTESLLKNSAMRNWVLYKLDSTIEHFLIDEAQDTSPAQWAIAEALTEEFFSGLTSQEKPRSLFVVGDFKQSIYSFQGADAELFLKMKNTISQRAHAAKAIFSEIVLAESYRSTTPILKAVDTIFKEIIPEISHVPTRAGQAGKVVIWPVIKADEKEKQIPWQLASEEIQQNAEQKFANALVAEVKSWIGERQLPSRARTISAGDIMILLRKRGTLAGRIVAAFKKAEIPISGADRMDLLEHLAVRDMLAFIKFCLLPMDDYTLACVLKSPLCNLSETEIFNLANNRKGTLFEAVCASSHIEIINFLNKGLSIADKITPFKFLVEILTYEIRKQFVAKLGVDSLEVLDALLGTASEFEAMHPASLQGFISWIELVKTEFERLNSQENVVRVMTVHGAKGLQAPIVILADSASSPSRFEKIIWQNGVPSILSSEGDNSSIKQFRHSEYMRLFYVALTRAEDELYIMGAGNKTPGSDCWHSIAKEALAPISKTIETPFGNGLLLDEEQLSSPDKSTQNDTLFDEFTTAKEIPAWATNPLLTEEVFEYPITPTGYKVDDEKVFSPIENDEPVKLGLMVHHLLQYLPSSAEAERAIIADMFLESAYAEVHKKIKKTAIETALKLLAEPELSHLWHGRKEVPIVGFFAGKKISGQVDLLAFKGDEIWIVDYKTNAYPPVSKLSVPAAYRRQMALYEGVLKNAYQGKKIRSFLLWTKTGVLMELD